MENPENKKEIRMMTLLFSVLYMVSYMTRINYGAIIAEMERATSFSRSMLSIAVTGTFLTYGAGQIISGIFGDKFSPKRIILSGLSVTVIMNICIPLCKTPYQMAFVWCINGFAQSMIWPPLVRLMTAIFSVETYKKSVVKVLWGSSIGTMAIYLVSPIIISTLGWRYVFLFSAFCGILMIIAWVKFAYDVKPVAKEEINTTEKKKINLSGLFAPAIIGVMTATVLQGTLRDGVTTWMPSFISETYNLGSAVSVLSGVILPIFSIVCSHFITLLYIKRVRNPLLCAAIFFAFGACAAFGLYALSGKSAGISVIFAATLTGCMHGVNLMLVSMIPPFFQKYGNISTASGVLNSFTYVGSALSTYGVAVVSENFGWSFALLIWLIAALLGTAICSVSAKPFHKMFQS